MRDCSVDGCERPIKARGWCNMHWLRWSKTGDPGEASQRHFKLPNKCTIPDCEKQPKGRGLCSMHYDRWCRHGSPEAEVAPRTFVHPDECTVPGCDKPYRASGLCSMHHRRRMVHGDPLVVLPRNPPKGAAHHAWAGEDPGYYGIHWRLHRRGAAKQHACLHCGGAARDWAYDHCDPNEKIGVEGYPYSTDLARYIPLCRLCHKTFDNLYNQQGVSK